MSNIIARHRANLSQVETDKAERRIELASVALIILMAAGATLAWYWMAL